MIDKNEGSERYDVIVVGGGLGGLSSAALLARRGFRVILFEQHRNVGGYASRFCRRAPDGDIFNFEASIHTIAGCEENGVINQVLREAGAEDCVEFVDLSKNTMSVVLPDKNVVDLPFCQEDFTEMLAEQFPTERKGIYRFFDDLNQIWDNLPATKAKPLFEIPADLDPTVEHQLSLPLNSILSSYFKGRRIFHYLYLPISYVGLDLSKIEFLKYAVSMREFFREKSYWISGGSQNLSDAFARALFRHDGQIRKNSRVNKILVDDGHTRGVELADGKRYFSDYVISNADATSTFLEMADKKWLPTDFVRSLNNMTATSSFFQVYLGLDEEFKTPAAFSTSFEICIMDEPYENKTNYPFVGLTNYTLLDSSLTTGDKQILTIAVPMKMGILKEWGVSGFKERTKEYYTKKDAITEELITIVESVFPGLRRHILVKEAATPLTFQRYTLNKNGSYMGFDAKYKRLPQKTPIEGLYLAGGWTEPHAGVKGVIISGWQAAEMINNEMRPDNSARIV